jgi:hypothetical protein
MSRERVPLHYRRRVAFNLSEFSPAEIVSGGKKDRYRRQPATAGAKTRRPKT